MARKTTKIPPPSASAPAPDAPEPATRDSAKGGKSLVIVESPTKAKTINKYLGPAYIVMASAGHIRDLPERARKGVKVPVPGVDIDGGFVPTYEVLPDKKKLVAQLKSAAAKAGTIWFATDLDREGEAIAWHLQKALDVPPERAHRVVFNAITKSEIAHAFAHPRQIDEAKVNAQQARRILDRIVGYQVSPLLWKKVAGGLSAGRVQSVAVRLVVEREREIEAFSPEEYWKVAALFTVDLAHAGELAANWQRFLSSHGGTSVDLDAEAIERDGTAVPTESGETAHLPADPRKGRTLREKMAWLGEHRCFRAELVEIAGRPVDLKDRDQALKAARDLGFALDKLEEWQDPKGKGPARFLAVAHGAVGPGPEFRIQALTTRRTTTRPPAPFITSTLQQAASNQMGFALQRTMRIAQHLYEGVDLGGNLGQTGLITYMRTDSTHLSGEALSMVRNYIETRLGQEFLPEKPNFYTSSNKAAQEAHEAIRPTDVSLEPRQVRHALTDEQFKLYDLIWKRFVASQMTPAQWDATTATIAAHPRPRNAAEGTPPLAVLRATGRVLVFPGFYRVMGAPLSSEEATLPPLAEKQELAPIQIDPTQHFTSPPPRYTEASLQKKLEEEGIGRPSTYAAIISTIQDRKYVQPLLPRDRRLMATDLGKVVTDKLVEAFPQIMDVAYTRQMEAELDQIEEEHKDWVHMLEEFYGPFKDRLEHAKESMTHAKAETEPAPHTCPDCGAATVYRFGRNGRFLSCSRYPDCKYAAPIDSEGNPVGNVIVDIVCPVCGSAMNKRTGRFGPFLGCVRYPECKGVVRLDRRKGTVVPPKVPPLLTDLKCPKCDSPLNLRRSKRGPWLSCSKYPKCHGRLGWSTVDEKKQAELEKALAAHEQDNPLPQIRNTAGQAVDETYIPQSVEEAKP